MPRLFFALQPQPAVQREMLVSAQYWLHSSGGRAMAASDLHLTLCFLGEVPESGVSALIKAASNVEARTIPLRLSRIDYWRSARVQCLLADDAAGDTAACVVARQLQSAVLAAGLEQETRPFRPHVTVARQVPSGKAHELTWPQTLAKPVEFHANGFVLMESCRDRPGPRYLVRRKWLAES